MEIGYLEDIVVGEEIDLGVHEVTEGEIIDFARRYDPQPFHVDPAAAERSIFGGLVASGMHTLSLFMRLAVDGFLSHMDSLGSPGIESVAFPAPLRPGNLLTGRIEIVEARPSSHHPERGVVKWRGRGRTSADELVLDLFVVNLFGRRRSSG
jgi:acyl dehydratase